MSHSAAGEPVLASRATLFNALGDPTRLALVMRLAGRPPQSISRLAEGSALTRQAISKHLRVLEGAGLVRNRRRGRESLFELEPKPLDDLRDWLDAVSAQWDQALARLKTLVEED